MRKILALILLHFWTTSFSSAQEKKSEALLTATTNYMQQHLWNPTTLNFARRADQPKASGSDGWGITIELDAKAYMVEAGISKPDELKNYFRFSSMLYEKTSGNLGARILARRGNQVYIG